MITTFLISLPIFLIIFAGWLMKRSKIVASTWIHVLNAFAYYVSLPALIVTSFWEIDFLGGRTWSLIATSTLIMILVSAGVFVFLQIFKISANKKTAILLAAITGNTIYMGFPLIDLGFGREYVAGGTLVGVIYLMISLLIVIFVIEYRLGPGQKASSRLYSFLKNPLVLSALAGAVLSFVNQEYALVASIKGSLEMLGATASPIALFALGSFIYGRFLKKDLRQVLLIAFLKMVAVPAVALLVAFYLYGAEEVKVLVLLASMPVAITTFIIAEKFSLDKNLAGNSIIVSTVISFIAAPLIIMLLS